MRTTILVGLLLFVKSLSFRIPAACIRRHATQLDAAPPVLSIERLTCSHDGGGTFQVEDVSYHLPRGAKVCLVGRNGAGKSTLMKIIAEKTGGESVSFSYTGQVTSLKTARVTMVEQEPPMPSDVTVADALLGILDRSSAGQQQDSSVYGTVRRYIKASSEAADNPETFSAVTAEMDRQQEWAVLTKAEEVATRLRVRHLQDKPLSQLSGGERKRVALAAALVQEPDVLLLDEPTNFLSLAGVQWLEELLADPALTILMVTHDRVFLDQVCDRILELDQGKLYEYVGKYADYLTAKEERLARDDAALQSAKAKYRVELDWMRRQPQARETKSKARIDAFYKLEKSTKPRPRDANLLLEGSARRLGNEILSLKDVSLAFSDKVLLKNFSYDFLPGDRICLAGANGVGKTTFVKIMTGQQKPDSGTVELGETIVMGVYDQLGLTIEDPEQTVLEFVVERVQMGDAAETGAPDEARRLLQKFEFPRRRWSDRLSVLSGGEKRRLQLLSVLSQRPNFLVLDEPSVDCDLDTLQAMETYLQDEYKGVLVVVSHDRLFADKVTDHLFVFQGDGEVIDFEGKLSEYATTLLDMENESTSRPNDDDRKTNYKEEKLKRNEQRNSIRQSKKEMDNLEKSMEKLRSQIEKQQTEIEKSADQGWSVLADMTEKVSKLQAEMDEKELRWMELAEALEGAELEV